MKWMDSLLTEQYHKPLRDFFKDRAGKMGKRLITIGWNNDKPSKDWILFFKEDLGFEEIMIVEAFESSARAAEQFYIDQEFISVYTGTIQQCVNDKVWWEKHGKFDACLWSHGPEHVSVEDHLDTLPQLFKLLNNCFVGWCPWGEYYGLGDKNSNPHQEHKIVSPTPETFTDMNLGLSAETCDSKDGPNGLVYIYRDM